MDKRYFVHNDWTGKYYLVNDRKSAVKLGNKMIEDWKEERVGKDYNPKDYDFEAHKELVPMQPGDVPVTYADTTPLEQDFGFKPNTSLREGLRCFAEWYARYYNN